MSSSRLSRRSPIVLLLVLFLAFSGASCSGRTEFAPKPKDLYQAIDATLTKGRQFFMASLQDSYRRVLKSAEPIQVDLYILVHYLMYQDELQFEMDPKRALEWKQKVIAYFLDSYGQGIWELESCLPIKVLTAFQQNGVPQERIAPIAAGYATLIREKWGEEGVGECFSGKVTHTYGARDPSEYKKRLICSRVSTELGAKVAYYQALIRGNPKNPLVPVRFPHFHDQGHGLLSTWSEVIAEVWVVKAYQQGARSVIPEERFRYSIAQVRTMIERVAKNEQFQDDKARHAMEISMALYAYLLADQKPDEHFLTLLRVIIDSQRRDGSYLSRWGKIKDHNIYATPTYFAMLAMNEFKKRYPISAKIRF